MNSNQLSWCCNGFMWSFTSISLSGCSVQQKCRGWTVLRCAFGLWPFDGYTHSVFYAIGYRSGGKERLNGQRIKRSIVIIWQPWAGLLTTVLISAWGRKNWLRRCKKYQNIFMSSWNVVTILIECRPLIVRNVTWLHKCILKDATFTEHRH
jgi:hypothetical protein